MSDNPTGRGTRLSVIAIAQDENKLKAVKLAKKGTAVELVWTRSIHAGRTDPAGPAVERELSASPSVQTDKGVDGMAVAGFDSAGVVFYRISVPAVKKDEIAAMVKLQAEACLPLPLEQMEVAWRADTVVQNGRVAVTVAAAKRDQLQRFVESVRSFKPARMLLGCEGIVKAWRAFFSGNDKPGVVVSIGSRSTMVCLAEGGRLVNAVSLDVGVEDFSATGEAEEDAATERFVQDLRSVLQLFGFADPGSVPVYVLADGGGVIEGIVSHLASAGLCATAALPELEKLTAEEKIAAARVYEYRMPIGLASMALDGDAAQLNVFERLYRPAEEAEKAPWFHSPRLTGALTVAMFISLAAVYFAVDVLGERRLGRLQADAGFKQLVQRQALVEKVARERADLLRLLSEINSVPGEGVMLDRLYFKRGQPVSISGQAPDKEKLYKFHEKLMSRKLITDPKIQNQSMDNKAKKLKFTIAFHYKSFTKKAPRP
ncbi:MAG: hypothetical protein ACYTEQ_03085 [Planctomycetota bacterium]|jgi:hypothetical protein